MWEDKDRRKAETERGMKEMPAAMMKHYDGSTGMGSYHDGEYRVVKMGDKPKDMKVFHTIDDMVDAGWVITT